MLLNSPPVVASVAYRPPKKQTILVSIAHGRPAHSACIAEKSRFNSSVQHPDLLTDRQFCGKTGRTSSVGIHQMPPTVEGTMVNIATKQTQ